MHSNNLTESLNFFIYLQIFDVTEDCKMIAKAVRDLCGGNNRFTMTHIVDVLKGGSNQKIIASRHNNTPYYGHLKKWQTNDVKRLLHRMITDEYLREDLIFCRDIPNAYLKLGANVERLMKGGIKIEFAISDENKKKTPNLDVTSTTATSTTATSSDEIKLDAATEKLIKQLEDKCHNDLLAICTNLASQRQCTVANIMNLQTIKEMSKKMPSSEEEMLQLPHVTKANFEKFGKELLETTCAYAAEKFGLYYFTNVYLPQGTLEKMLSTFTFERQQVYIICSGHLSHPFIFTSIFTFVGMV